MTAELGQIALLLALAVALVQGTLPLAGAARGRAEWMALARPAAQLQGVLVALAFACLVAAFVRHDFSVSVVAVHSSRALPLAYRVSAAWAGHEGSMLLWVLALAGWGFALARFSGAMPPPMAARVLAVMGLVGAAMLAFLLATSNPFGRVLPAADGRDLNPLLQHPGMVLHPPLLFMGQAGLAVGFAFALAALLSNVPAASWARWTRPWATAAWSLLTLGIMMGSWWAYHVLGWGGWWFWDPVENASFMPWLACTALIHSLAITDKRGGCGAWTALLAIAAFSLALLGTFLVRSGVLSSVHAFAVDPRRGLFVLVMLVLVVGGALAVYAWRAPRMGGGPRFALLSRESLLLANNVVFVVALMSVLVGTLFPLVLNLLGLATLTVGVPYFDSVFLVPMVVMALLLGVGPLAAWRDASWRELARRLRVAGAGALVGALLCAWATGRLSVGAVLGLAMSFWIVSSIATDLLSGPQRGAAGMLVAHLGVAVFAFGVCMVKTGEVESQLTLRAGTPAEAAGYAFTLQGLAPAQGANHEAMLAHIEVARHGRVLAVVQPEKRLYRSQRAPISVPAVVRGLAGDVYVALGEPLPGGAWIVRVQTKPFVAWIWAGCVLMALGGGWAVAGARRRRADAPAVTEGARA